MDIKSKSFSHSLFAKGLAFIIAIICFTGAIYSFADIVSKNRVGLDLLFEDSYYQSSEFSDKISLIVDNLNDLSRLKSEDNIVSGDTANESRISSKKNILFSEFETYSSEYDPSLSYDENYDKFESVYSEKISKIRDEVIAEDLDHFNSLLDRLKDVSESGIVYYYSDGESVFSNTESVDMETFKSYPTYTLYKNGVLNAYPNEAEQTLRVFNSYTVQRSFTCYLAFTEAFIKKETAEFKKERDDLKNGLMKTSGFMAGLLISFIYLTIVVGRKFFKDKIVHMSRFDKLYTDINIMLCLTVGGLWLVIMDDMAAENTLSLLMPITAFFGSMGLLLVLSMVKHIKNRSFLKHTLIYTVSFKLFSFFKDIYDSGSVAVKVAVAVIAYPLIVAATFFMFPITIGLGVWLAHRKTKEYLAISKGVAKIKNGDMHHSIYIANDGEFKNLANDINNISNGLSSAIDGELKSEKMKTELITNVSHDIRTPLTSIITYIDLLKNETNPDKKDEYLNVLDKKSQRLKVLTEDLFEAAKASSGDIPVTLEKLDIVSLMTQGLGELDDKVGDLDIKLTYGQEKLFVLADGKLLWRAIENLLSNVFKYALSGSRVYLDFAESDSGTLLTIKNISAHELNISSEELMERFKRGDESRCGEGSGLGLSIAKSLLEMQKGRLDIDIDGDLFKAIVRIPKYD